MRMDIAQVIPKTKLILNLVNHIACLNGLTIATHLTKLIRAKILQDCLLQMLKKTPLMVHIVLNGSSKNLWVLLRKAKFY